MSDSQSEFFVGFTHASKNDFIGPKTTFYSSAYLTSTHAIGSEAGSGYHAQYTFVEIGLERIVYPKIGVAVQSPGERLQMGFEYAEVIIIKRRFY
jgi:hypothetical protein